MKRKEQSEKPGAPAWMTTYGDMVTLLLTFFVLMYSFSSVDSGKWENMVVAFSGGRGVLDEQGILTAQSEYDNLQNQLQQFQGLYQQLQEYIEQNNLNTRIELSKTDSEIKIRFVDNVLFDSGNAKLKQEAVEILSKITLAFHTYNDSIGMVRIEGHTDNVAINTSIFPSNWELSTSRAVEVLRFLIEKENMDATKVSAVGYGEYHPIADNNNEFGRAKNRRVDIVIDRTVNESGSN